MTVLDWIRAHAARDPDHPALIASAERASVIYASPYHLSLIHI